MRSGSFVDLRWRTTPVIVPWIVALLMFIVTVSLFPGSMSFGSIATQTPAIGVLVLASIGQSLVIGTGGIDLSVSSVITIAGVAFVLESGVPGGSNVWGIVFALILSLLTGIVNGIAISYFNLSPLVTTLATGEIITGIASIWFSDTVNKLSVPKNWQNVTNINFGGVSLILLGALVVAVAISLLVSSTALGRRLTSASTSPQASIYQGIQSRRYRASTYIAASLLYGIAGVLLVGNIGTPTLSLGSTYQLSTIVAVVLGGAALSGSKIRPWATVAGALFLSLISVVVTTSGTTPGVQGVIQGATIIVAMGATGLGVFRAFRQRLARRSRAVPPSEAITVAAAVSEPATASKER